MKKRSNSYIFILIPFLILSISIYSLVGCKKKTTTIKTEKQYIHYSSQDGGYIVGKTEQLIQEETEYETVIAIAKEGYRFLEWNDGLKTPERIDSTLLESTTFFAKFEKINYSTMTYTCDDGGYIVGESIQTVETGYDLKEVIAIPKDGYRFTNWSDGITTANRTDKNLTENKTITAFFEKIYSFKVIEYNELAGKVEGDLDQIIVENELSSEIEAIPNLGYKFICWSNGELNNKLQITAVEDIAVYPIFQLEEFELPIMSINTENSSSITSKDEYLACNVSVSNTDYKNQVFNNTAKIKGRGNTTWNMPKKPYKLKFDKKIDLFGNGSAKTWVLLANYCDKSMLRNHIAYNLGITIGLETTTTSQFVDLYLNGIYQGVYEICEQNEVGKTRVNIKDDLDSVDTGYLIELDSRADGEGIKDIDWFEFMEQSYAIKSPDTEDKLYTTEFVSFIKEYLSQCYDALESKDWALICSLMDIDTFARSYIINEIMKSCDIGYLSFYMYKKQSGKLYCGPLWDYDISSGNCNYNDSVNNTSVLHAGTTNIWYKMLLENDEFKEIIKDLLIEYKEELIDSINIILDENNIAVNSFNRNFIKWDILNTHIWPTTEEEDAIHTWEGQVDYLKNWLLQSIDYLYDYYVTNSI